MSYNIIWPEVRSVSASQIDTWYDDAQANGELDERDALARTTDEKARALHHAGVITLGSGSATLKSLDHD